MTATNRIPFLDLVTPHQELKEELCSVFETALETAAFVGGPMVEQFERAFATYCDAEYCVGVGSGTDALRFILIAAGIEPGEIVVTVPNTFIATTEAISQAGARPDFVDIDERTYNMSPKRLQEYLEVQCTVEDASGRPIHKKTGRRVAAVIPVHLYGQTADMDPILELAERYNLTVVEDACQAHGAQYFSRPSNRWRKAGSMGKAAAFSFYPGKNLGACGEAGAVTTDDAELVQKIRMLRDHGQAGKYYHEMEGYNGRLDAIQAGILRVKLRHLTAWNEKRRECARRYQEFLGSGQIGLPYEPSWAKAVYHLYVIRTEDRDELRARLDRSGIATGIHYPIPLHLQNAYRASGYQAGDFPVSERIASEVLSLPMYPQLQLDRQRRIAHEVAEFLSTRATAGCHHEVYVASRA
jgi:dTDP-4-amino-4,6-dideoxygalactose transaminase